MLPNAHTDPRGTIYLSARVHLPGYGHSVEARILDACADTQTAEIRVPGRFNLIISFSQIYSVALKYQNGEIIETFGRPNIKRPESLAYIKGVEYA